MARNGYVCYNCFVLLRTTIDFVVNEDDPRAMGEANAMLKDGDFGRYLKSRVNHSSTEDDTLRKVRVVEVK